MVKLHFKIILGFLFLAVSLSVKAQAPGCAAVDAGDDITIPCYENTVELAASYFAIGETSEYEVSAIPYDPPFPFDNLDNPVSVYTDDIFSQPIALPFAFCYFGDNNILMVIGSNGVISFDISNTMEFCDYRLDEGETIPSPTLYTDSILLYHDIDPSGNRRNQVGWEVFGEYPCRTMVVAFHEVPYYYPGNPDNSVISTFQIVLYETTNVIDFYIREKPDPVSRGLHNPTNQGRAALGIQDDSGTLGYSAPGRNTGQWSATYEAWRFTPSVDSHVDFKWLDENGNQIGTSTSLTVTPPRFPYTYTAQATYYRCDGGLVILEDEVTVYQDPGNIVDLGDDIDSCDDDDIILNADPGDPDVTYQWFFNGTIIPGATNSTYAVTHPNSGLYYVEVTDIDGCVASDDVRVTFLNQPIIASQPEDLYICGFGEDMFDLTYNNPIVRGTQSNNYGITYHHSQADAETRNNPIIPANAYFIPGNTSETIWVRIENEDGICYAVASFEIHHRTARSVAPPSPHYLCDYDNNGEESIDLETVFSDIILDGQSPSDVNLTFHGSQADANAGVNPLSRPYTVTISPTTIYARVENRADPSCYSVVQFDIIVLDPPDINANPDPLVVCDIDNDGFAPFDLREADDDITLGNPALEVSYFLTLNDAVNNTNRLFNPHVNQVRWNDFVYARVEEPGAMCFGIAVLPLEVRMTPDIREPRPLRMCDDDFDGFQIFDLTVKIPEILGNRNLLILDVYFYEDEDDAIAAGEAAMTNPNFSGAIQNPQAYQNLTNPQTVYVLAVGNENYTTPRNGGVGCYSIVPLRLIVDELPNPIQPLPYELCDDEESGSTTDQRSYFNLTTRNSEITGGNPVFYVTWFETYADEANDNPIADPRAFLNTVTPQTVIARVTSGYGCGSDLTTLTLVVNPLPVPIEPTPLEICDDHNGAGVAVFDLTVKDDEISSGEPGMSIRYFETQRRAEIGDPANEIPNGIYINVRSPYLDSVWARMENDVTGCYSVVELALIVHPLPDLPTEGFGDLRSCDTDGGTSVIFDLTLNSPFVYGNQSPDDYTISFHISLDNAENNELPIVDPEHFESSGQTIWVRLEDNETGCVRISSFELIIGGAPEIVEPEDMELCDDEESGSTTDKVSIFNLSSNDFSITGGNGTLEVVYYESEEDQQNDIRITNPQAYSNPIGPDGFGITPFTIFISVFDGPGCVTTTTMDLIVLPAPIVEDLTPLVACDVDNEGFAYFDLTQKDQEVTNGNPAIVVTYHETEFDAINGTFPLASPFQNIVAHSQIIYVRATFGAAPNTTGCYTIVPLELIAAPNPVLPVELPDLVKCDNEGTGHVKFDLTIQEPLIYGDQNPDILSLTYHLTQEEADTGVNPIVTPEAYFNITNPQVIYVRLAFIDGQECYITGYFNLIVIDEIPIVDPEPLSQCTELGQPNTERAIFDLTSKNIEITNGLPGLGVSYFLTEEDAQNNTNRILPDYAFENIENPQRVYVRVIDGNTDCVAYTTLLLRVLPNPEPVTPSPLVLCDVDDNRTAEFDLTLKAAEILNGENWRLSYFETYEDAMAEDDEILDPEHYVNITNPQIVYVRVTNDASGCYEIVELELIVAPIPGSEADVSDYIICEIDTDELAEFDLTTKIPEILGELSPLEYLVSFYIDQVDAINKTNAIVDPERHWNRDWAGNIVNPQTIYVGIEIDGTECYVGGEISFDLIVQEGAIAVAPAEPFVICDNLAPSDGIALFDLEDFSNVAVVDLWDEILAGQSLDDFSLYFYESMENAITSTDTIVFPYQNVINPQIIYAKVTNQNNIYEPQCSAIVEVVLKVEELPEIIFNGDYRLCVDSMGFPLEEESGSMSPPILDTFMDPTLYTFEWFLDGEPLFGQNDSALIVHAGGEYMVVATEIGTGCISSGTATVWTSSPPLEYDAQIVKDGMGDTYTITVTADGLGEYVYSLNGGPFQESNIFANVPLGPGDHTVTIRDIYGCGSVEIKLGIVDYPKFFTPNNDGYHDTWNIYGLGTVDPDARIQIFDRYGKLIKEISPIGPGWDGTYNGNPMPSSDYWFRTEYEDEGQKKLLKGHFALKR